jgi:hypothetical protein
MSEQVGRLSKDRYGSGDIVGRGVGSMNSSHSRIFTKQADFFSLTPDFSPATRAHANEEPLKRFSLPRTFHIGLKAGANENEQS